MSGNYGLDLEYECLINIFPFYLSFPFSLSYRLCPCHLSLSYRLCLEYAHDVRLVLTSLLDKINVLLEDDDSVKKSLLRLKNIRGKRPLKLLAHQRFRAAYDFLLLRAEAGEDVQELANWWTEFQDEHMDIQLAAKKEHQQRRFRRRPKHHSVNKQ